MVISGFCFLFSNVFILGLYCAYVLLLLSMTDMGVRGKEYPGWIYSI